MENNYRHEHKFLISQAGAELLRRRLSGLMKPDPHAGETGQYTIRSLYFDDLHFSAYDEKMAGICDRVKYRLRCYNGNRDFIRLEKKEKRGNLTRKTGQTVTAREAKALQDCCRGLGNDLLGELHAAIGCGLRPAVLVEYDRTPFVCDAGNTRITLDESIRTKLYRQDLWESETSMLPVLEHGQVVLEVKYDDFLPGYLAAALEDVPKVNLAISKYVLCANIL